MELGLQLREPNPIPELRRHIREIYGDDLPQNHQWLEALPRAIGRVYLGDEFCVQRLPRPDEFDSLIRTAAANGWKTTLLTPPLTDDGLRRCRPLLDRLQQHDPCAEVVVNDWGVLLFLKQHYATLRAAVGRLLNRGFKDPRLGDARDAARSSPDMAELLNRGTFDDREFCRKMAELGVERFERDLLPYELLPQDRTLSGSTSIYFPFGYITTGRVCWVASFQADPGRKFSLSHACGRPCSRFWLALNHDHLVLRTFQDGNTVFYLYPPDSLRALIGSSSGSDVRLVYQGIALQRS
jgi:hypothetical protein